ncbi:MAG: hypothetical protein RLZZ271_533, partial [Pseudomonadota bacterium]
NKHNGLLSKQAIEEGLEMFAEHTEDARAYPGKHANIDRLLRLLDSGEILRMRLVAKSID